MSTMTGDTKLTRGNVIFTIMFVAVLGGPFLLGGSVFVFTGWYGVHMIIRWVMATSIPAVCFTVVAWSYWGYRAAKTRAQLRDKLLALPLSPDRKMEWLSAFDDARRDRLRAASAVYKQAIAEINATT